jgi:hypothetical protein
MSNTSSAAPAMRRIEVTALGVFKSQFKDLDDGGIAYAVGSYCGHIATSVGLPRGARLKEIEL